MDECKVFIGDSDSSLTSSVNWHIEELKEVGRVVVDKDVNVLPSGGDSCLGSKLSIVIWSSEDNKQ